MLLKNIQIFALISLPKIFNFFLFLSIFSLLFFWDLKIGNELINTRTFFIFPTIFIIIFQYTKFETKNLIFYLLIFISLIAHLYLTNYEKKIISVSNFAPIFYITFLFFFIDFFFEKVYRYIYLSSKVFIIIFGIYILIFFIYELLIKKNIIETTQACNIFFKNFAYEIQANPFFFKFFLEPSHLAMAAVGPIVWSIYNFKKVSDKEYFFGIFIIFILILVFTSMTLLAGFLLTIICIFFSNYSIITKKYKKISFIALLFLFAFILLNNNCSSRITRIIAIDQKFFSTQTEANTNSNLINNLNIKTKTNYEHPNVTSDVYRVNILITLNSIEKFPFGWGINNYGVAHNFFVKKIDSQYLSPESFFLNNNDGRSNFLKLLVEFGIFSLIFFIYIIYFMFAKKIPFEIKTIFCGLVITQMGSGAGYFNGGFIFIVIFSIILIRKKTLTY
jgi:hypothetical protein